MSTVLVRLKSIPRTAKVPLIINSDLAKVEFLDFKAEGIKKGSKINAPLSLALLLVKRGNALVDKSSLPTLSEINKLAWLETKSNELQRVTKDFYIKSSLLVWSLLEKPDNFENERRIRFLKALLMDIVKSRLQKIMKLALSNPVPSREIINALTFEEEALYLAMCDVIGSWLRYMKELIEGRAYEREHDKY